ncbi:MAG: MCE family protein [Phycisphaerales bacterium]|jgi:ABC-type transporter Mla subunit MlaD|nr:MCE family protein [Phycisphaerales bacterium]
MARKQHNELTAGIFTILTLVLLGGVVFWLGASDILKPAAQEAWFYVELDRGEQGLKPGAQVKITDVEVGAISDVQLDMDSGRTYYIVKLFDDRTKVYSDAQAKVNAALVGGGAVLQILDCGKSGKAPVKTDAILIQAGDLAKTLAQFNSLGQQTGKVLETIGDEMSGGREGSAMYKIHAMMDVLDEALKSIRQELDSGNKLAMLAKLHQTVEHLRTMAADAEPKVASMLTGLDTMVKKATPKVDTLLANANKVVGDAGELVAEFKKLTKGEVAEIIKQLHETTRQMVTIAGNFAKVSEGLQDVVTVNRDNIDNIIDNMGQVAANLKSASKEIRRNPWRLLYRPDKAEMHSLNIHDAARSFSDGASQLDQALAKLKGLAAANPKGIPAADPQLKKIAEQIKVTFEKFTDAEKALWKELLK